MSLAAGDLTTLATVQAYVTTPAPSATIASGLITRMSRLILNEINRSTILPKTYSEYFNGTGTRALVLPNWPLLTLNSLYIDGANITEAVLASSATTYETFGWSFQSWNGVPPGEPAVLSLSGGAIYWGGTNNIGVNYVAGYKTIGETGTVDSTTYRVTPAQLYGQWATDEGVTYIDGTPFTAVTSSPSAGQYIPPAPDLASNPRNYYQFSQFDQGQSVLLSYGYVPFDLEQVALELIAERTSYRTRPGIRSQMIAGQETVSYFNNELSGFARMVLDRYKSVLPPAMGVPI